MAENPIATAYVEVRPDTERFGRDLEGNVGGAVRTIGQAIAAVQIGQFVGAGLREFESARDGIAQTGAAIRSTGGIANVTEGQVSSLSERLGELAAVDDDIIRQGANLLLTFTNVRNEVGDGNQIFDRAVEAATNMGAALGGDASTGALQLGKALNDPITGLTALTRAGVSFSEQQKDQVRTMVESGDVLGAQKLILEELEHQFGGSAEAQASALDRLDVALGDFKESIGEAATPLIEQLIPVGERLIELFDNMPTAVQGGIIALGGIAVAARPINEAIQLTRTFSDGLGSLRTRLEGVGGTATLLSRLGPAIAAAGGAAGVAAIVYSRYTAEKADAAAATRDFVEALKSEEPELNVAKRILDDLAGTDAGTILREAGADFQPFIDAVKSGDEALETFGDASGRLNFEALQEGLASGEYQATAFTDAITGLYESGQLTEDQYKDLGVALQVLAPSYANAEEEAANYAAGAESAGIATETTGEQIETAVEPTQRFADRHRSANDQLGIATDRLADLFNISDALPIIEGKIATALSDAADEAIRLAEANATGSERQQAFRDLLEGSLGDVDAYTNSLLDQGVGADEAAFRTNLLIDDIFALRDEYGLTRQEAEDLRIQLGLDYPTVTATVQGVGIAETNAALAETLALMAQIRDRNEAFVTVDGRKYQDFNARDSFAVGGIVPGAPGEPRMIEAHGGERIDGTWADHSRGQGGVTIQGVPGMVVIQAPDSESAGRAAGRSIRHLVNLTGR